MTTFGGMRPLTALQKNVLARLKVVGLTELAELAERAWKEGEGIIMLTMIGDYELQVDFDVANEQARGLII